MSGLLPRFPLVSVVGKSGSITPYIGRKSWKRPFAARQGSKPADWLPHLASHYRASQASQDPMGVVLSIWFPGITFEDPALLRWYWITDYPLVLFPPEAFWSSTHLSRLKHSVAWTHWVSAHITAFLGCHSQALARSSDSCLWGQWTLRIIKCSQLEEIVFFSAPSLLGQRIRVALPLGPSVRRWWSPQLLLRDLMLSREGKWLHPLLGPTEQSPPTLFIQAGILAIWGLSQKKGGKKKPTLEWTLLKLCIQDEMQPRILFKNLVKIN